MFDRFTDRARKVMGLARQEAQRFNHDYIDVEHVLLGLIQEGSGVAADVLKRLGVDPKRIRREIEGALVRGNAMPTMGRIPFTPRARRMLELSLEEARGLSHLYIGTEHLLLGLIREGDGIAGQVLREAGVRLRDVREEVLRVLGGESPDAEKKPHSSLTSHARGAMDVTLPAIDFSRFADRSRVVMGLARQEAQRLCHDFIGTEHILLGLVAANGGAVEILEQLGIHPNQVREETEKAVRPGNALDAPGQIPFTPSAKRVLELTVSEAHGLGHDKIRELHLLLGLLLEKKGTAAQALAALGVTYEATRNAIAGPPAPPD